MPDAAHGTYRARPGETLAVLTTTALPPLAGDETYVGWARHGGAWVSLGAIDVAGGKSLNVAEGPSLASPPDELRVTRERAIGAAPAGAVVLAWSATR